MAKKTKTNKPAKTKTAKAIKKAIPAKKKTAKKKAKERPPKVVGDLPSDSREAQAIYRARTYEKHREKILKSQKEYDAKAVEKKNKEFLDYYDKQYPVNDE